MSSDSLPEALHHVPIHCSVQEYGAVVCKSQMPTLQIPNDASIHTIRNFTSKNSPFCDCDPPAILKFHPKWVHMDPLALCLVAAWGGWCRRQGLSVQAENLTGQHLNYAMRMRLFHHLGIPFSTALREHEESGRFMPIRQVKSQHELDGVIADVSALLHLESEPDGLAAVQYCVSELIRNVLEHSGSTTDGAYVCAQRYPKNPKRITLAVADSGWGIAEHLGHMYPEAKQDGLVALNLAMRPGVTGAQGGIYGTPDNAGAGLFITRAIARATGGYFVLLSGDAILRLKRVKNQRNRRIFHNAISDPRHDAWKLPNAWSGTAVALEVATDEIKDFHAFFQQIRNQLPAKKSAAGKIKFT